jgi:hypothetical protein
MSRRALFDDGAGHRVELLALNQDELVSRGVDLSDDGQSPTAAFASGTIGNVLVRCLSRDTQFLFHTGFQRRPRDIRDVRLLSRLGTTHHADSADRPDTSGAG